jgi:uncharacterized protein (TIGR03118 family)
MKSVIGIALGVAMVATPVFAASKTYSVTNLVSDQPSMAMVQDTDLINPWGLAQASDGAPVWSSDQGTSKSTFYDRTTGEKQLPVVAVPGGPTGIVAVPSNAAFTIGGGHPFFLFDTLGGKIYGWVPSVDENNALLAVDRSAQGAVYTGLAFDTTNKHLLAADFGAGTVEIFDTGYNLLSSFTDPNLPKKFAPFNVQVLGGKVYVAYALPPKHHAAGERLFPRAGKSKGFVDVFDLSGNLQTTLISGGHLNAPWGLAIAPSSFGKYSNKLLVGNFGDGTINAYDPTTGDFLGTLKGTNNKPLQYDALWSLDPGPGKSSVTFSAGLTGEIHGLIGVIKPN